MVADRYPNRIVRSWFAAAASFVLLVAGCSQAPPPPELPKVSASKAAAQAIELGDTNDDGELDINELAAAQMLFLTGGADEDGNQIITADEIKNRIRSWQSSSSLLITATPTFTLNGQPLEGATVTLTPPEFLQPAYPTYTTVTGPDGKARFTGSNRRYPGLYLGFYNLRVSKIVDGEETIPAMYNTETVFGFELTQDDWLMAKLATIPIMSMEELQRLMEAQQ